MDLKTIFNLEVRPRQVFVFVITTLYFIVLFGLWKCIDMKGDPFSLFDWWGKFFVDLPNNPGTINYLLGILFLSVLTLIFFLIAFALGWLSAAFIKALESLVKLKRNSNEPKERTG